ncbi:hypothetical protein BGZ80_010261 [Entomortierella chlamydospora]|uniref:Uncharacterized protein n=1 Tax=Entomortierella chlamydospora TaxID=101097 RepID=A0A9P6SZW2_9FUNG|nr:hypothetical protein BGZ80_010261 [Entomortierella chlamydospora]
MGSTTVTTTQAFVFTFPTDSPLPQSQPTQSFNNVNQEADHISASSAQPNRHSCSTSGNLWENHQQQQQQQQQQQHQWKRKEFQEKATQRHPSPPPGRAGGPRLSLDTSFERLQNFTVIQHGDQSYLKLFSPALVESPVSFLSAKQILEDKKLWEGGPDEAFQRKLDMEKRETYQGQCLDHDSRHDTSPMLLFVVFMSCVAAVRAGTRCLIVAVATLAAVLTCFATLIANQSQYSTEFRVNKSM